MLVLLIRGKRFDDSLRCMCSHCGWKQAPKTCGPACGIEHAMVKQVEERKYKHVYFHKASKTWTAVRKGYPNLSHRDQDTASKIAAKAWRVSHASLRRHEVGETVGTVPSQGYKHVTWHSRQKVWVVQGKGDNKYLGSSTDQMSAVHIACRAFQCKLEDLELPTARRACSTSSDTCHRMALLMRVYAGKKRTEPMVPADIQHLMHEAVSSKTGLMSHGVGRAVVFPYIISKFPIHRDAIALASSSSGKCTEARVYQALLRASRVMSGKAIAPALVRNVGRKNMHHGSFVMFASKGLKMLRLVRKNIVKPGSDVLRFGKHSTYAVMPMNHIMERKLSGLMAFGEALASSKPPRTLADWRVEVDRLTAVIRSPPTVPGCSGAYRRSWAIRCGLIYKMRQHGIKTLIVEEGDTVRQFLGNFPDQKSQVLTVAGGKSQMHRRMIDVFSDCGRSQRNKG
jgi:hypothetical protein